MPGCSVSTVRVSASLIEDARRGTAIAQLTVGLAVAAFERMATALGEERRVALEGRDDGYATGGKGAGAAACCAQGVGFSRAATQSSRSLPVSSTVPSMLPPRPPGSTSDDDMVVRGDAT